MVRKNRSDNLLTNLPQLQNLIKRDPQSYQEEFNQQLSHFEASLAIFKLKPDEEAKEFGELVGFLSQVVKCYPKAGAQFPDQLIELIQQYYTVLNPDLRRSIVQALVLMRSRGVISHTRVMPLFFTLFRCRDKGLRRLLYAHIVNDVKLANKGKHRDNSLNKSLQGFMYTMITAADAQDKHGEGAIAAKKSLDVCIELYRKRIWTDVKAINVIAQACLSPITKIMMTAVQFFLNPDKKSGEDGGGSDSEAGDDKAVPINMAQHQSAINKKTKHRNRKLQKATKAHKRAQAKKLGQIPASDDESNEVTGTSKKKRGARQPVNFDILSLIHDPQGFAEKLFARVHSSATATKRGGGSSVDRFEVRLILLKLVSRLIGHHQLQVMAFYPFLQRYLQPHQVEVTQIMAVLANGTHAFTPPDVLQPLVRAIADNFVADHCAPEVMCAGLNTIRAVATRQPLAVEPDMLSDLILYRKHKDKGVMMAARSLLELYREVNPEMLHRRDRGREATINLLNGSTQRKLLGYGEAQTAEGVDGAELLQAYENAKDQEVVDNDDDSTSEDDNGDDSTPEDEDEDEDDDDDDDEIELAEEMSSEQDDNDEDVEEEKVDKKLPIEMTRFLTDEDFAKIDRLKRKRNANDSKATKSSKRQKAQDNDSDMLEADEAVLGSSDDDEDDLSASEEEDDQDASEYVEGWDIIGDYHSRRRRRKATYEERISTIQAGREGRERFGSSKSKREKEGRSLSNKEKRKTKDYRMVAHKRSVVSKGKRSLTQKRRALRQHIVKQKKKGF